MSSTKYNLQFEKLCKILDLGDMTTSPVAIQGGLLNRMYGIKTTQGKYALKALNPQIMLRPEARQNYINSEEIVGIAAKNNIPALPANRFNGIALQEIDSQFYLVFHWIDGRSLKSKELSPVHCEKIGTVLADIHKTDFSELSLVNNWSDNQTLTDWNYYLQRGQENNSPWHNQMLECADKLYRWDAQANRAARLHAADMILSHRDLDPKNVIWNHDNPIIIDWEAAGFINPMQELTETAIYWSEDENGDIDKEKFLAVITGYKKRYGTVQANWNMVLVNGFLGKLGWLEYSLKRSLRIECTDEKDQLMGTKQVTETLKDITRYANMIPQLKEWMSTEI